MATKGTIVPGILSSRSRTPLPKLMQSSAGRFMPSVTGSPFDDELLCSALPSSPFPSPPTTPRRSPIDPTCLRLKTPLLPPASLLRLFLRPVSLYSSASPPFSVSFLLSTFPSSPAERRKVSRDFFALPPSPCPSPSPSLPARRFLSVLPAALRLRYRSISASLYSACAIVLPETIKPVVYG